MNLTKIYVADATIITHAPMTKPLPQVSSDILILVPDLDSFHEVMGQALLFNKNWEVHILEPGKLLKWQGMYSPWHHNSDKYRLEFKEFFCEYTERV